jgi:hypothetical protein
MEPLSNSQAWGHPSVLRSPKPHHYSIKVEIWTRFRAFAAKVMKLNVQRVALSGGLSISGYSSEAPYSLFHHLCNWERVDHPSHSLH